MDNPETQTTQQRLTKKGAIKNGQSRDPENTEQRLTKKGQSRIDHPETQTTQHRLTKKGAIKNGQSRDPDNTEQRLTKKNKTQKIKKRATWVLQTMNYPSYRVISQIIANRC